MQYEKNKKTDRNYFFLQRMEYLQWYSKKVLTKIKKHTERPNIAF